jgi:hypothetical protein
MANHKPIINEATKAVLDCLDFSVMLVDPDHDIHYANRQFLEEQRKPLEEVVGMPCYLLCHGLQRPCQPSEANCPVAYLKQHGESIGVIHNHSQVHSGCGIVYVSAIMVERHGRPYYLCLSMPVDCKNEGIVPAETRRRAALEAVMKSACVLEHIDSLTQIVYRLSDMVDYLAAHVNKSTAKEQPIYELHNRIQEMQHCLKDLSKSLDDYKNGNDDDAGK